MTSQSFPEMGVSCCTATTMQNLRFWTSEKVQSQSLEQEDFRLQMQTALWAQILPTLPPDKETKPEPSQNASSSHLLPNVELKKCKEGALGLPKDSYETLPQNLAQHAHGWASIQHGCLAHLDSGPYSVYILNTLCNPYSRPRTKTEAMPSRPYIRPHF